MSNRPPRSPFTPTPQKEPLPAPYRLDRRINPFEALDIARADVRAARRQSSKWAERVGRWHLLLVDPPENTRRTPQETQAGLENARQLYRAWTNRVAEVERVIVRLKRKTRVTFCENPEYQRRQRKAGPASGPQEAAGGRAEDGGSPSAGEGLDPVGRLGNRP